MKIQYDIKGVDGVEVEPLNGVKAIFPFEFGEGTELHVKVTEEGIVIDVVGDGEVVETVCLEHRELLESRKPDTAARVKKFLEDVVSMCAKHGLVLVAREPGVFGISMYTPEEDDEAIFDAAKRFFP
jgi:hypothetical protein